MTKKKIAQAPKSTKRPARNREEQPLPEGLVERAAAQAGYPAEVDCWPAEKAKKARVVLDLVERSFESGSEVPGLNPKSTVLLREALRAARDDMWVITTAAGETDTDSTAHAEIRAYARIDLALALHDFLREEEAEGHGAKTRATSETRAAGGAS